MVRRVTIAIILLAAVILATWWLVSGGVRKTFTGAQAWAGDRFLAFANRHLRPEFGFDRLEYDFPATFVLHGARLVDEGTSVLEARSLSVTLTGIPKRDEPFIIQAVSADALVVRLIERADGTLLGFHDMIERAPKPDPAKPDGALSSDDGFAIRTIAISGGRFEWHIPGHDPLVLDDLDLETRFDQQSAGGVYQVSLQLDRKPFASLALDGRLDLDAPSLEIANSQLTVELASDQYQMLPPGLQSFVRAHEVRGKLAVHARGRVPFGGEQTTELTGGVRLENGSMSFGEYVFPAELIDLDVAIASGLATFDRMEVRALGGTLSGAGDIGLSEPWGTDVTLHVKDVHLEQALRPRPGTEPRFEGQLTLDGTARADLAAVATTVGGEGHVEVHEGTLVKLPGFGDLVEAVTGARIAGAKGEETTANFALVPGEARLTEMTYLSTTIAGRGEGEIHFAGTVNVRFNAGPIERVEHELGVIGDIFGKITDRIVTYQLLGPVEDPTVEVRPLGFGVK